MGAYEESIRNVTFEADDSLAVYTGVPGLAGSASPNSGNQYRAVKITAADTVGLADATANELVIGVVQNKPQVEDAAATVAIRGISLIECAGSFNAGAALKVNNAGKFVAATLPADAALVVAVAVRGGANGKLSSALLRLGA